jgi:hypothetical protein
MISKHKTQFESITDKVWKGLSKEMKTDLSKYRRVRRDVIKFEEEIKNYRSKIKEKQNKIKHYNKILTHLYGKINILKSDFIPSVNVVPYKKGGDMIYWNINVTFGKKIKSIYLGRDDKIREIFKDKLGLRKNISQKKMKETINYHFCDDLMDLCIENKEDFHNMKIKKEQLFDKL